MTVKDQEDAFAGLLAECDEAVADHDLDRIERLVGSHPELARRLEHGRECIELLQRLRPGDHFPSLEPGTAFGPYQLLREIGQGGFGVVYMAEQLEPVRRKVALKVIKPGMDTREVVARFAVEQQALALMDHPHIAHVFDAGTTDQGRPYFVMELVNGVPITEFCNSNNLATRERLQLFIAVCHAVQHAHQKGIIHRDLKPTNVLIALDDGRPIPKIIDFGVAKAISRQLTEETLYTRQGQMVGTPQYMSPEQARMGGLDVDTRSDIYSLGVLLYELLTGTTPVDLDRLSGCGFAELMKVIQEEEPPKPSARLSSLGGDLTAVCRQRNADPRSLEQLLRGELDWIVMRSLEKDRNRRYETASSFAQDVECHLDDQPVSAGPPSAWYRMRKSVRRNKPAVIAAAAVAVALLSGLGLAIAGLVEARDARGRALVARAAERRQRQSAERSASAARRAQERIATNSYFQTVALAQREWLASNPERAVQLLRQCPPERRGWEWHFLNANFHSGVKVLQGHELPVWSVTFSPDGRKLASTSGRLGKRQPGEIIVWDAGTGRALTSIREKRSRISDVAFSPDGRQIASAGFRVALWDVDTGRSIRTMSAPAGVPGHLCVAFDARTDTLIAGGTDGRIRIWNPKTGELLRSLSGHTADVQSVTVSADGNLLASTSRDGTTRIWDLDTGSSRQLLRGPVDGFCVDFSPDGRLLAASGYGRHAVGEVRIWQLGKEAVDVNIRQFPGGVVRSICFAPDNQYLAVVPSDGTVHVWEPASGRDPEIYRAHTGTGQAAAFSPDGRRLATAGRDRTVKLWDRTANSRPILRETDRKTSQVAFGAGGKVLGILHDRQSAVPSDPKRPFLWDLEGGRRLRELSEHKGLVSNIAASRDGRCLATGGGDCSVFLWDAANYERLHELNGHRTALTSLAFGGEPHRLASSDAAGVVKVWDPATGEMCCTWTAHAAPVKQLAFAQTGAMLATVGHHGRVRLWDSRRGELVDELQHHDSRVVSVAFSPDGEWLASGDEAGEARLWRADRSGRFLVVHTLPGQAEAITGVAFTPDGTRLASIDDVAVRIWDVQTGQEALSMEPHRFPNSLGILFSFDGRRLAALRIGQLAIMDAQPRTLPAEIESSDRVAAAATWHDEQAEQCVSFENLVGAALHLRQLRTLRADDPRILERLGDALAELGDLDAANECLRQATESAEKQVFDSLAAVDREAWRVLQEGIKQRNLRRFELAVEHQRRAIVLMKSLVRQFPQQRKYRDSLARFYRELGHSSRLIPNPNQAAGAYQQALELWKPLIEAADDPREERVEAQLNYANLLVNLATMRKSEWSPARTEAAFRSAVEIERKLVLQFPSRSRVSSDLALSLQDWSLFLIEQDDHDRAEELGREALDIRERLLAESPTDPSNLESVARSHLALGTLFGSTNRLPEARAACRRSLGIWRRLAERSKEPRFREQSMQTLGELAEYCKSAADYAAAVAACRERIQIQESLIVDYPDDSRYLRSLSNQRTQFALVLFDAGLHGDAIEQSRLAFKSLPAAAESHNQLAWVLASCPEAKLRKPREAVQLAETAVRIAPERAAFWNTLGVAYYRNAEWNNSIAALNKSVALRNGGDGYDWYFLAMVSWQLGQKAQARDWFHRAVAWHRENRPQPDDLRRFQAEATALIPLAD